MPKKINIAIVGLGNIGSFFYKVLEKNKFKNGKDLFDKFYEICEDSKIDNKDFFSVAYRAIIGKDKGPRLAEFILFVGQEKIAKLLGTIK